MLYPIIGFIIAAVFGLIMLRTILKNQSRPNYAIIGHGAFALGSLGLLIFNVATHEFSLLVSISLGLFVLAAIGGFTLLTMDLSKKPIPKAFALGHPFLAIIAIVLLVVAYFK